MCNHGILLNSGELIGDGPVKDIISQYIKNNHSSNSYTNLNSSKDIYFEKIELINSSTGSSNLFLCNHSIDILFSIKYKIKIDHTFRIIIRVMNNEKQILFSSETPLLSEKYQYKLSIPPQSLTKGAYSLSCIIYKPAIAQFDNIDDCCGFTIENNSSSFSHLEGFNIGSVYKKTKWE
jgi:hypothetical protein